MSFSAVSRRMRLVLRSLLGAALAVTVAPSYAQPAPLPLDEAVRLAVAQSARVGAAQAQTQAARERAVAAAQRPDPVLRAGIENMPVNGPERFSLTQDFMTMRSIGVMQELTRGDKLRARGERAAREADVAGVSEQQAAADVQREAALAWLDRSFQQSARELLVDQLAQDDLQAQGAEALYRSGKGAQAEVFAARSAAEQVRDRITQTARQIAVASTQLARWIGAAAQRPSGSRPEFLRPAWASGSLTEHLARHPQIAAATQQEALARAEADLARANKRPDWSIEFTYSQRGPSYSNMVSFLVSVPLPLDPRHRQDRELAAALATSERAAAERSDALRAHEAEVRAMLQEWDSNEERLRRYDERLLPLAQQRADAALTAYRAGTGTLAALIDARRAGTETQLERLRIEMEIARLWAQLTFFLPDALESKAGVARSSR